MATISFALPLVIVLLLYIIVCRKLWSREIPGEGANHNQHTSTSSSNSTKSYPYDDYGCCFIPSVLAASMCF